MWVIFGWQKIETPLGEIGSAHCFDCQRESRWEVWNVDEWVTFSALKVFRFIHKHELQCMGCATMLALHPNEFKQIDRHMRQRGSIHGTPIHSALAARIEGQQLALKTAAQRKYIKETMKARQECSERIAAEAAVEEEEGMM